MSNLINIIGSSTVEGLAPNQATFTISLTEVLPEDLTLKYSTVDGTAINGTTKDYTRVSNGSITFEAGETVKDITIEVRDDNITEPDESFFVQVFIPRLTPTYNPGNTDLLAATGIGTITDTLTATSDTSLVSTIENLLLEGSSNINGTGNGLDNVLTGNSGNNVLEGLLGQDTLEGKGGTDTLKGGLGDDFYIIEDNLDVIEEEADSGFDTVYANVFYQLGENLENLVVNGNIINGQGNQFNNLLVGNNVNNKLYGYSGNDTLQGNNGADSLYGGWGDDTYIIDPLDVIYEYQDTTGGIDTIQAGFTYGLWSTAHVENLYLIGSGNFEAVGDAQDNKIVGNSGDNILKGWDGEDSLSGSTGNDKLYGHYKDDVLEGGYGRDTLEGGPGDDVYLLNNPEDINDLIVEYSGNGTADRVEAIFSYTLGSHLENLKLIGTGDINATGNNGANVLTGNSGDNILDGLAGNDIMIGGSGDDTYIVENITDQVIEEGTSDRYDTVISYVDYTLEDLNSVENLSLVGNALSGTGNDSNNEIIGNQLDNSLSGNEGKDTIDGGLGNDTLNGGAGADIYLVDSSIDIVIETLESSSSLEKDWIQSSAPSYTLPENVENLDLLGTDNLEGIGNELNNLIIGNSGNNNLVGNIGDDSLEGNIGDDTLVGNDGDDTLNGGLGVDILDGGLGDDVYVVDNPGDVVITGGATDGNDAVVSEINYTLGSHLENLTLTGTKNINGRGNELDNFIFGNTRDNGISGGLGDDWLDASSGDDFVSGGLGDDYLDGDSGNDFVIGNEGDDTLIGGRGIDTLVGGVGNERYFVDDPEDIIIESVEEGSEEVYSSASTYTLSDNLENLILTGSKDNAGIGNDLDNRITGNSRSNIIDGGEGFDTLAGGTGSDNYIVDRSLDVIIEEENLVTEVDTAFASVYYVLDTNVENLVLTGTKNIAGKGNAGANFLVGNVGNNWLDGLEGNDTLDGGAGKDTLLGGTGDDTYVIDNVDDDIRENSGEGLLDTVQSLVNYTLAAHVENLVLLGTNNLTGEGNVENNLISGNNGDNVLSGKSGDDTLLGGAGDDILSGDNANDLLEGGAGADRFTYDSGRVFSGTDFGTDNIADFTRSEGDKIALGKTTFGLDNVVGNGLWNYEFESVTTDINAQSSSAKIVYSSETGNIFYNENGTTLGNEALLTTLDNIPSSLIASDFVII